MLVGIVGKTNVGKSTFFKAATLVDVEISNRVFVTIKPNQGVGYVTTKCACGKHGTKCDPNNSKCENGVRMIPVRLLDVAGLVPDAHKGRGLGVQFLDDLSSADALIHVIDASGSTDGEGNTVAAGSYDPERDVEFLPKEIDAWFTGLLKKNWDSFVKKVMHLGKKFTEELATQLSGLKISEDMVKHAMNDLDLNADNPQSWNDQDLENFAKKLREASKQMITAANKIDVSSAEEKLKSLKARHGDDIVPCSAECELALREAAEHGMVKYVPGSPEFEVVSESLNEKQEAGLKLIKEKVLDKHGSTGVQECLNRLVFGKMDYIVVYPVANIGKLTDKKGKVLPDAHLVPAGTTLREFAYRIHTEIGEKFIGGLDTNRMKLGADHVLKDGDVVEILVRK
jgi:ribosome-binding ATPase YchF (GTP1/OBG family)